jgi:hypothetical protein
MLISEFLEHFFSRDKKASGKIYLIHLIHDIYNTTADDSPISINCTKNRISQPIVAFSAVAKEARKLR